ncbi:KAP family P-loop domain-containing protein [Lentzea waywayandensis]|uniref:KAP family P-loop domain-containing protein n=1 Tax=Lentzea waywayandensis TaxID=84724 RepID=A0A1I6FD07_9PSEU|nr:P-loop NTPase fold protein [Lentzea waywayandensis]SFR27762.1 KAP family P-loop domain-containing protein [Lentzea waywayandensis]
MTHARGDRIEVVLLTSSEAAYDELLGFLSETRRITDPDGARFETGMVFGTDVRVVIGLSGLGKQRFKELVTRARSLFRPTAVLFVASAASVEGPVDGVVVALSVYDGDRHVFVSPLLVRAHELARTSWWEQLPGNPLSQRPTELYFGETFSDYAGPRPTSADSSDPARPVVSDRGEAAALILAEPQGVVIYGIGGAEVSAVRFAMTLAVSLDRSEVVVRQLKTMGHGDRVARTDLLARRAFVESLAELLAHSAPPDDDQDLAGPTVIAIEGAWGSGKSTLMTMTRGQLDSAGLIKAQQNAWKRFVGRWRQRKVRAWDADFTLSGWFTQSKREDVAAPRVLTAMFNPWSYQTGEHVWAGLNDCIVSTGAPVIATNSSSSLQRFWFAHNVEQLDRSHVQRTLRKRIVSPLLRLGVFALPVPLLAQLVRAPDPFRVFGFDVAPVDLALWVVGLLLGIGLLHSATRYVCRAADTLLPAELFGPSGAMGSYSTSVGTDDPLRDPQRRARKGQLHSAQEDVHRLIRELGEQGTQLVVFIDDLDRCSPRTTADVFEAINGFLSGSFPTIRFVLGIDAAATAAHLDAAYSALVVADAGRDSADPSPGWTFLRKLIQLPLPLPRVAQTQVEPLLTGLLGTPGEQPVILPEELERLEPFVPAQAEAEVAEKVEVVPTAPAVLVLEHDEQVKERFAERLRAQPDLSVREAKRIVTVWMFYVRVLDRISPEEGPAAVRRACHLVLLAEIVARWPASQRSLHRRIEGVHGLRALAEAVDDNVRWEIEVQKYELTGDRHKSFRKGVQKILEDYDGAEIATLAEQLT